MVVGVVLADVHFKHARGIVHRSANKSGEGQHAHVIGLATAKGLVFTSACWLVAYEVRIGTTQTRRAHCLVSIHHNAVVSSFFNSIKVVIVHPLTVMVFASRNDIPYITAFYGGVFVLVHQLIGFIHKTLVVADRRGSFVVHNHLNSFAFGVLVNSFDIKIGVRCLEVEYQIFGMSKPIFPPDVPTFYEYAIKTIFGGKVDVFLHIFGSSPVLAVGFEGGVIGFTDMHTGHIVSIRPFFHTGNHFPPYSYVLHRVNPRSISQSTRFVEVEGNIRS